MILSNHGLVVFEREEEDPRPIIQANEILKRHEENIVVVKELIRNDVSSTKVRDAVNRGHSIKYLVPDEVVDYIERNSLYK